ncbi:MAG: hypothetical protein R3C27_11685 [Hyphomonadaceae bacterium]
MTKRRSSLTGSWSGAYRYPGDAMPETVFNALIEEVAGAFTGKIEEPNLTRAWAGPVNTALIEGARESAQLNFIKYYTGDGGMHHMVMYQGVVDDGFTRIDGAWTVPGAWSGTFFMTRDDLGEAADAEVAAEAETPR